MSKILFVFEGARTEANIFPPICSRIFWSGQ